MTIELRGAKGSAVRPIMCFVYGLTCYAIFFITFLYLIAFLANLIVPKGIDDGVPIATVTAVLIDLGLIALFGIQHSVMARPAFKKRLAAFLPQSVERSTFVLASSVVLIMLYWQWRPLPQVVWFIQLPVWQASLWGLLLAGFGIVFLSTFVIDHFDMFGLRQVWLGLFSKTYRHPSFRVTYFYKFIRHPLYLGLLLGIWCTPLMTLGHLLFAMGMSVYILIGVHFEERDLEMFLGEGYRRYKQRVPMLIPNFGKSHETIKGSPQVAETPAH
jgi:protein-S-isoprenylcysteine O-methyltransferase Ste14